MSTIRVVPTYVVHRVLAGGSVSGVSPSGDSSYSFDYDNEAGGPFTVGEDLSWSGGTGKLGDIVDDGTTGRMNIILSTGPVPSDNVTITGGASSATCDVDGTVTNGLVDSEETIRRGRYRKYDILDDGGLLSITEAVAIDGFSIMGVSISAAGLTAASFNIINRDSEEMHVGAITSLSSGNGFYEWRNDGLIVAPGCSFQVVGTGTLTSVGRILFIVGSGWPGSIFDTAPILGTDSRTT